MKTAAELYHLDKNLYNRFSKKNHCLSRALIDPKFPYYHKHTLTNMTKRLNSGEDGYSRIDVAFSSASWTVANHLHFATEWYPKPMKTNDIPMEVRNSPPDESIPIEILTKYVKKASKFYGSTNVGIAGLDRNWLYDHIIDNSQDLNIDPQIDSQEKNEPSRFRLRKLSKNINRSVVITIEMDSKGISTAPKFIENGATGLGYSKMFFIIATIAEFIRNMGYVAIPSWNDVALSIPLGIDAGLGALGRHGLLITKEYGPRVRLCKVLTNMPLEKDSPDLEFIEKINQFCKYCRKCAEICDAKAISNETEPDYKTNNISNNPGIKKWYVNGVKCYGNWVKYSSGCSKCIKSCPFSKIKKKHTSAEFWLN